MRLINLRSITSRIASAILLGMISPPCWSSDAASSPRTPALDGSPLEVTMTDPAGGMRRVGALTVPGTRSDLACAVIDPEGGFAYFGTLIGVVPMVVVKVRLSDFTVVAQLELSPNAGSPISAVIDSTGGFIYFGGGDQYSGSVSKVRISDFTLEATLTGLEPHLRSAVIDPINGFAYFGSTESPGRIVKIRLSDFKRVGGLTLQTPENNLRAAVIDPVAGFAYFATNYSLGESGNILIKVKLSNLTRAATLTPNRGEYSFESAAIDLSAGFAYFGATGFGTTDATAGRVVKIRLSDFSRVGALPMKAGENYVYTSAIDSTAGYAFFGTGNLSSPVTVVKVRLSDFTRVGALKFNTGETFPSSAVYDPFTGFLYIGTRTTPAKVVKVDTMSRADRILRYLLGRSADPTGLDLNSDKAVDASDLAEEVLLSP